MSVPRLIIALALLAVTSWCSPPAAAATTTRPPPRSASSTSTASTAATVDTAQTDIGTALVGSNGHTLYKFDKDKGGKSSCAGACAAAWPPLTSSGQPTAGNGVSASKLGVTTRSDGKEQVTYAGHPLYYYAEDTQAGPDQRPEVGAVRRRVVRAVAVRRGDREVEPERVEQRQSSGDSSGDSSARLGRVQLLGDGSAARLDDVPGAAELGARPDRGCCRGCRPGSSRAGDRRRSPAACRRGAWSSRASTRVTPLPARGSPLVSIGGQARGAVAVALALAALLLGEQVERLALGVGDDLAVVAGDGLELLARRASDQASDTPS